MEQHSISSADYLDILYDNRNKQYGGYVLRKYYERRMITGILSVTAVALLLSAYTFIKKDPLIMAMPDLGTKDHKLSEVIFEILPPKPPIIEPPAIQAAKPTVAFTVPVIKNDDVADPTKPIENPGDKDPGKATTEGDPTGTPSVTSGTGPTTAPTLPAEPVITTPIFIADVMPEFNGDINAYLNRHTRYPEPARENHIQGKVIVQFVVDENGQVTVAKIMRGIGGGCNEEALRVVRSMPKWKPGKQNGRAVKVYFTLPIHFVLQ
jgi:protein TonB